MGSSRRTRCSEPALFQERDGGRLRVMPAVVRGADTRQCGPDPAIAASAPSAHCGDVARPVHTPSPQDCFHEHCLSRRRVGASSSPPRGVRVIHHRGAADTAGILQVEPEFMLLGEPHDNPEHHRARAEQLRRLIAQEPKTVVVFRAVTRARRGRGRSHRRAKRPPGDARTPSSMRRSST